MGTTAAIFGAISTAVSMAGSLAGRQNRSVKTNSSDLAAQREAEASTRLKERRDRLAAQKEDAREREQLQKEKRGKLASTYATGGSGLLGDANVGSAGLKSTLGE